MEPNVEHVVKGDDEFKARMRFHQSWLRCQQRPPLPAGPHSRSDQAHRLLGNMLTAQDAEEGRNFLVPSFAPFAKARQQEVPEHIDRERLLRNMLGSQPMCFNLFTPLVLDLNLALRFLSMLPQAPAMKRVTKVLIEYAPKPAPLNDGTSHDAFVEYERPDGRLGFIGIETKLTEPFSQSHVEFHMGYAQWKSPSWWWKDGAEAEFSGTRWNQQWRNQLLAYAMLKKPNSSYAECRSAVVYHKADDPCIKGLAHYRKLLTPQGDAMLLDWRLDVVISSWLGVAEEPEDRKWLALFRQRYLDLEQSQAAWDSQRVPVRAGKMILQVRTP